MVATATKRKKAKGSKSAAGNDAARARVLRGISGGGAVHIRGDLGPPAKLKGKAADKARGYDAFGRRIPTENGEAAPSGLGDSATSPAHLGGGGAEPAAPPTAAAVYVTAKVAEIWPSPLNPRTHFNQAKLEELAGTLKRHGLFQPVVVREKEGPAGERYELVMGERRWRAAKIAGLSELPARVVVISDEDMREGALIENVQRDDLTALERARAFRALIDGNPSKHSAESIARRIDKSPEYVWGTMKLLDLVPEAKELLEGEIGGFSAAHAIEIVRLEPEAQKELVDPDGDLWQDAREDGLFTEEQMEAEHDKKTPGSKWAGKKVISTRELRALIQTNHRFDPAKMAKSDPLKFEGTALAVEAALAEGGRGKRVVPITYERQCPYGARAEERTFGCDAWKRADGAEGSKPCDHRVTGLVVAGPHYGETLRVCINRDKCTVHWPEDVKHRAAAKKAREKREAKGGAAKGERPLGGARLAGSGAAAEAQAKYNREFEERQRLQEQRDAVMERAGEAMEEAVLGEIRGASLKLLVDALVKLLGDGRGDGLYIGAVKSARTDMGTGKGPEHELRVLVWAVLENDMRGGSAADFARLAAPFGNGVMGAYARAEREVLAERKAAEEKTAAAAAAKKEAQAPAEKKKGKGGGDRAGGVGAGDAPTQRKTGAKKKAAKKTTKRK